MIALDVQGTGRVVRLSMKILGARAGMVLWVPAPISFGGVCVGGQPAPRLVSSRFSGTLTLSARRFGTCSVSGADTAPGLHPRTPAYDCPEYAGTGGAEHLSMKNDGPASRRGFPVPAPIGVPMGSRPSAEAHRPPSVPGNGRANGFRPDHLVARFHDKGKICHTLTRAPSSDLDRCWRGAVQQSRKS